MYEKSEEPCRKNRNKEHRQGIKQELALCDSIHNNEQDILRNMIPILLMVQIIDAPLIMTIRTCW
jgi:hypothetical protein